MATAIERDRITERDIAIASVIATMRKDPTQDLTLQDQADIAGLSQFHFARTFRDVIGIPPGEYLTALRFERAKHMLLSTDASVTDICFDIGYESLGTFSSRFRQLVGVSPQQFRRFPDILSPEIFVGHERPDNTPGTSTVRGTIGLAAPGPSMSVYIGVFPAAIARGYPVAGRFVPHHGYFEIPNVPPGTYRLLAAAVPADAGPLTHLAPGNDMLVAASRKPVAVPKVGEPPMVDVTLRRPRISDPPVLISLPALMLTPMEVIMRAAELGVEPLVSAS